MKQNALVNEQQIEETSNHTQSRGNKNNENKNNELQQTKISNDNKNIDDNDKVSKKTDTFNLVINILNTLEKSIRSPTKISVKKCTASDITPTTTLSSAVTTISTIMQVT